MITDRSRPYSWAQAVAFEDPALGTVIDEKGWRGEVVSAEGSADRELRISHKNGEDAVLKRYGGMTHRPSDFPPWANFIASVAVWASDDEADATLVWINPADPAELASNVAAQCVTAGWELENAFNLVIPPVKTIHLKRDGIRRCVSIMGHNVTLFDRIIRA